MQMHSSYVVTDPKGTILVECGKMLQRGAPKLGKDGKPMKDKHGKVIYEPYRIKVLNTINFKKSMHYNPFAYIHSEKDILKLVTTLIANSENASIAVLKGKWGYLNNFEFVMNKAYALNRDRLKCRVCGKWLIDHAPYTHRINPYLSLDKVNRVNNLISVHKKCYMAINTPGMDISDYEKQVQKKILSYREKLVVSHTRNN